jgi:trimeric autotransporter adhesin
MGTLTMGGTLTSKAILPDTTLTYDIGSTGNKYNTVYAKATSAQYADLAEIYESDQPYPVGTVVIFGGDKEITQAMADADPRVAGVISENPAYLMNSNAIGQPVALMGKVKCRVVGHINKGDMLSSHSTHNGVAKKTHDPQVGEVIGKALEDYDSEEIGTIKYCGGKVLNTHKWRT